MALADYAQLLKSSSPEPEPDGTCIAILNFNLKKFFSARASDL